jgi:hypothetical protein
MSTLRTDESVKIPAAVLAAQNAAEAYYQPMGTEADANEAAETSEQTNGNSAPEVQSFNETGPQTSETTDPQVTREVTKEDDQSWEHKYKSMKGRFDRSQAQISQLSDQIQGLQNVISTLQSPKISSKTSEIPSEERFITPEEESDYGHDFLNVVGKKAKEELLPIVKQYESKIASLEQQLANVGGYMQNDARQRMLGVLEEKVPNWQATNKDENFIRWLQLPDLYSGAIRHNLLKEAYERNDTPRVAAFFQGFLAEEAAMRPATADLGVTTGAYAPKVDPMTLAAPGRAKSAAADVPAEKPFFTSAQITRFYADVNTGKFRGREAEKAKIEAQIFDAQREGRIG